MFKPSTAEFKAGPQALTQIRETQANGGEDGVKGQVSEVKTGLDSGESYVNKTGTRRHSSRIDLVQGMSNLSLALSLGRISL